MESDLNQLELSNVRSNLNRRMGAKKIMKNLGINPLNQLRIARAFIPKPALTSREFVKAILSPCEMEIVKLMCNGLSCQEIADYRFVSYNTIKKHVANIYLKTSCRNRAEMYTYAFMFNII